MPAPAFELITDVPDFPLRAAEMHKGQAGAVSVVAGSRGMSGAAILCGIGALRCGAGLVRVCCGQSVQPLVAAAEPSLMTTALPEDEAGRLAGGLARDALDLTWPTVLAIGPGLGQSGTLGDLVLALLADFAGPVVLDADGLNNLSRGREAWWEKRRGRATLVTPHPGEMARLRTAAGLAARDAQDDDTRQASAHEYAARTGMIVVLKGHHTVVATEKQVYVNATGNPGMAGPGMGDVLTGMLAALLAQGLPPFDAARLGVHLHGFAGDRCARDVGPVGFLAREVANAIPLAIGQATTTHMGFR